MKPFGYGYVPKPISRVEIKENLRRWAWFGEAHVDNVWSETLKYIEELEQSVMEVDIVEQIDKLIRGWEREYGVTNQTMVNAKNEIERLREELLMSSTQLLIRRDMITHLKSGPGGIMEMKQTIADKETEIRLLQKDLYAVDRYDGNLKG